MAPTGETGAPPLSVVGFFRTQAETDLRLRDEEVDLVRKHFCDPSNVVLLIQTAGASSKGGFLFWSDNDFYPFSFLDFPLDVEELRSSAARNATESLNLPNFQPRERAETVRDHPAPGAVAPRNAAPQQRRSGRVLAAVSVAAIVLTGLAALWLRNRPLDPPKPAVAEQVAASPIQLEVEARGNGVDIRWNPANSLITHAVKGNLVVAEQGQPLEVTPLDPANLATGHAYYQVSASRFEIQLQVEDASGKIFTDSIVMLSSRNKAAQPAEAALPPAAAPLQATSGPNVSTPATIHPPRVAKAPTEIHANPRIVQTPVKSVPPQENRAPVTDGAPQPGNLIMKVNPVYPENLKESGIQGTVRFAATISKDGRIQDLQLLSGNPALVQPATEAVKQWQYRPITLDGQPVDGVTQIDVEFALNR